MIPAPFNARTRVHEYGGGSWTVRDGAVTFSNFADGRLYRQAPDASAPQPLTPEPPARDRQWRFADGVIDHRRNRWIGVREDHTAGGEPVNTIVAVDLGGGGDAGRMLASGHDFYASPRLSPDGNWLAWLAWDHPNMPWNGTLLYLAAIGPDGAPGDPQLIAGGATESIFQPEWSPDGARLAFVSDRSGWWNLYAFELATRAIRALAPMAAEFGAPQWVFGMATYAFAAPDRIVCTYTQAGLGPSGRAGSAARRVARARYPVHRIRLGAGGRRPRRVSRRRARPPGQHRGARSRLRPAHRAEAMRPTFSTAPICALPTT